jgi:putative aldouronate transport system permease protein
MNPLNRKKRRGQVMQQILPAEKLFESRKERSKLMVYLRQAWPLYVMMLPAVLLLIVFNYYPMYGIVVAFQKFNPGLGFWGSPWVGLKNFERLVTSETFYEVVRNTVVISSGKLVFMPVVAVSLALLLNEVRHLAFKRTIQTVLYLPHFLSWIVLGGILVDMLSKTGFVNYMLTLAGFKAIPFLTSNSFFIPTIWITHLWQEAGWSAIIYLAALTGIDPQLYEAAACDGASRWQQTIHISLPGLVGIITILFGLNLGSILVAGFDQVFNLFNTSVACHRHHARNLGLPAGLDRRQLQPGNGYRLVFLAGGLCHDGVGLLDRHQVW